MGKNDVAVQEQEQAKGAFHLSVSEEKFNTLTPRQQKYFRIMHSQSGVLFITAEPGVAKSAIMKSIATKLGFEYADVRLSMVDEIDVGLFPYRREMEIEGKDGNPTSISVMAYAIPEWAYKANQKPTIIHFEELNRAPQAVRNAALQLLLERGIGTEFKFNDNVMMVASGNLGDKDGTDVEEFDRALNNRLIHFSHTITLPEWVADFAEGRIHPTVINFLETHEEHFLHSFDEKRSMEDVAYATPRSWTFLSDYIVSNFGIDSSIREWSDDIRDIGTSFVGSGANGRFVRYLDESMRFGVKDLLNRYDEIVEMIETLNRDKKSELLNALKGMDLNNLKDNQKENVKRFILTLSADEAVSFILKILDEDYKYMKSNDNDNDLLEDFLSDDRFLQFYDAISAHVPDIED